MPCYLKPPHLAQLMLVHACMHACMQAHTHGCLVADAARGGGMPAPGKGLGTPGGRVELDALHFAQVAGRAVHVGLHAHEHCAPAATPARQRTAPPPDSSQWHADHKCVVCLAALSCRAPCTSMHCYVQVLQPWGLDITRPRASSIDLSFLQICALPVTLLVRRQGSTLPCNCASVCAANYQSLLCCMHAACIARPGQCPPKPHVPDL